MQPKMCTKCKKNIAVVFITKIENGVTLNEGYCLRCARGLEEMGLRVFSGPHQAGTLSFLPEGDCEEFAEALGHQGIALRAGLHCAPLAHESAGTLESGTVRVSFGYQAENTQTDRLLFGISKGKARKR